MKVRKTNRITYEPEQMSQVVNSFLAHLNTQFTDTQTYLQWRAEIVPFLAETPTHGRSMLFNPAFISTLIFGRPESRYMCRLALQNIVEDEFTRRIREIEQHRQKESRA